MSRLSRWFLFPANESALAMVLAAALVVNAGLLIALVWLCELISRQRELIAWLWMHYLAR